MLRTGIRFQSIRLRSLLFVAASISITCPSAPWNAFIASSASWECFKMFLSTLPFRIASARGSGMLFSTSGSSEYFSGSILADIVIKQDTQWNEIQKWEEPTQAYLRVPRPEISYGRGTYSRPGDPRDGVATRQGSGKRAADSTCGGQTYLLHRRRR